MLSRVRAVATVHAHRWLPSRYRHRAREFLNPFGGQRWRLLLRKRHSTDPPGLGAGAPVFIAGDRWQSFADPCLVRHADGTWLFFELYDRRVARGVVAVLALEHLGDPPVPVLFSPEHLSFPIVYRFRDDYWLTVESVDECRVALYRCLSWPARWMIEEVLLRDVTLADPAAFCHHDQWWLYASDCPPDPRKRDRTLRLWRAPALVGPWREASCSPVVRDPRNARLAGRPFLFGGALWRPAQDCGDRYGHRVRLNRVVELSDSRYREHPGPVLECPVLGAAGGCHSLSVSADWEALDVWDPA